MTTVAERTFLKDSRRVVRVAHTSLQQAMTDWGQDTSSGRATLTALSNDVLTFLYLPHHDLGPLKSIPGLVDSGKQKLLLRIDDHVLALTRCIQGLADAQTAMATAVESVAQVATINATTPVFQCLSAAGLSRLLLPISEMHAAQLTVRIQALMDPHTY